MPKTTKNGNKVTITDIAKRLQIHPSTVSRALNPQKRHLITQGLAKKISKLATELGYHQNPIAYALKKGRSAMIGILIPDLLNPVFPSIILGAQESLEKVGITALVTSSDNNEKYERTAIQKMRARLVDGLIIATSKRQDPLVEECLQLQIPLVLINRTIENIEVNAVVNDDKYGIHVALEHLTKLGHRKIAHIAGPQDTSTGHDRYLAFLNSSQALGLGTNNKLIGFADNFTEEDGHKTLKQIINNGTEFTAIIAANDELALGCLDALAEADLKCPDDISLIGYNDMIMLDRISPPLTTVRIQHYEIGEFAAKTLIEIMDEPSLPTRKIVLRPELIVRGSTKINDRSPRSPPINT